MATALDLRHRLPKTLGRMRAGKLSGSRAALIARQSRCLPAAGCAELEDRLGSTACRVGYRRLRDEVDALLIDIDPIQTERRAKAAEKRRYVNVGRDDEDNGIGFVSGRIDGFGAEQLDQALDHVAGMLKTLGVTGSHDVLRAQALAWLANPAAVLRLAQRAATEDDGESAAASYPDTADAWRPPEEMIDPDLWPRATVYVHLDPDKFTRDRAGAVVLEGAGSITTQQAFLALRHHQVRIQPVIDLHRGVPSTSGTFTGRLRESVILKAPTTVFPYSDHASRQADIDHSEPRGPTSIDNGGPLARRQHRAKTHGRWTHVQLANGIYLWRSPHGRLYLVDRQGHTHDLGDDVACPKSAAASDEFRPRARSIPSVATSTTTKE